MKKRILPLLLVLMLILGGCSSGKIIESVDSLMVPPSFYEEYEELVTAFRSAVGDKTSFCPPVGGDYRSAIVFNDMDGDGTDEAIVFYTLTDSPTVARMHYLDVVGGKWISLEDFSGYGTGIESVSFTDMSNNGLNELFVTWNPFSASANKVLSVYKSTGQELNEITNLTYNALQTLDIDGDGQTEIFYISQTSTAGVTQRSAKVLKLSNDSIIVAGEAKLDSNVSGYASIKAEKVSGDMPMRIYADALKGENQMITEVVYWDSDISDLVAPLLDTETMTNTQTLRSELIPSMDINNDGTIDIPVEQINSGSESALISDISQVQMVTWINLTADGTEPVLYSYINMNQHYMMQIDADSAQSIKVKKIESQNCWVFSEKDETGAENELYSIISVPAENKNDEKYSSYTLLLSDEQRNVYGYIGAYGKEQGINESKLVDSIAEFKVQNERVVM